MEGELFTTEQILYLWRIPIILIFAVIVGIILSLSVVEVDESNQRADAFAAQIAFNQELFTQPGTITSNSWSGFEIDTIRYSSAERIRLAAGKLTLHLEGEEDQIKYTNQEHYNALDVQGEVGRIARYFAELPVSYKDENNQLIKATLNITVAVQR